tara:strand:- start:233 stop:751 length:519 start_codon:yes stop_codon:yes gene_type:complete
MSTLKVNTITNTAGNADIANVGKIVQVVQATTNSAVTNTTTTFEDTNLTANITPSSNSNKILIIISQSFRVANGTAAGGGIQILRGSTVIQNATPSDGVGPAQYYFGNFGASSNIYMRHNTHILDSPSTTSATTYKTQFRLYSAGTGRDMQANPSLASSNGDSYITLMEVSA